MRFPSRGVLLAAAGTVIALSVAGCSSGSSTAASTSSSAAASTSAATSASPVASTATSASTSASTVTSSAPAPGSPGSLAAELPDAVRKAGVLHVGTSTEFPPYDFNEVGSKTLVGFDPDFEDAIGQLLGIKFVRQIVGFDALVPGVQAKRFDIAINGASDTKEREKVVDFVDYGQSGVVILVPKAKASSVTGLLSLCGHSIGYATGTYGQQTAEDVQKICKSKGKPGIKAIAFPNAPDIQVAQEAGRVDFHIEDTATGGYDAKLSKGEIVPIPLPSADATGDFAAGLFGVVIPKGQKQLAKAIQDAFNEIIQNGTYQKILDKWGVGQLAVKAATYNTPSY